MDKRDFLQKYIIARTSHKRNADELFKEALQAYERIENNVTQMYQLPREEPRRVGEPATMLLMHKDSFSER